MTNTTKMGMSNSSRCPATTFKSSSSAWATNQFLKTNWNFFNKMPTSLKMRKKLSQRMKAVCQCNSRHSMMTIRRIKEEAPWTSWTFRSSTTAATRARASKSPFWIAVLAWNSSIRWQPGTTIRRRLSKRLTTKMPRQ